MLQILDGLRLDFNNKVKIEWLYIIPVVGANTVYTWWVTPPLSIKPLSITTGMVGNIWLYCSAHIGNSGQIGIECRNVTSTQQSSTYAHVIIIGL